MKKNLFSLAAAVLAVGLVVFSGANSSQAKAAPRFSSTFWQLNNPSAPLQGSSYSSITQNAYNSISCSGVTKVCKLESATASLPSTMADDDHDNIPDENTQILDVPTKN